MPCLSRSSYLLVVAAVVVTAAVGGGCGQLGTLFMPDPRPLVPAQFKLTEGKIVVLIDDYRVRLEQANIKEHIADKVVELLKSSRAARKAKFLPYKNLRSVKTESPTGKKYSIKRIGEDLGADVVLYVDITQFDLEGDPQSPLILPQGQAHIKVIEVETGDRLWPIDVQGHPVHARGRREAERLTNANRRKWSETLADMLATEIAELFYEHRQGK